MKYWLLKTEPETYSYHDLEVAGSDTWDGVRNFQARANIKKMAPGDQAFIYHTGRQRAIVGIAEVVSEPYPDPGDHRFLWIDVRAVRSLPRPVSLSEIKAEPTFADWELVRLSRLSVMPVPPQFWSQILMMAK
ncbi:MAG: EVE domain-containing protein [Firmicutes bacterium]|nr:EVE domain-containing protein [Bacillota bacterium]